MNIRAEYKIGNQNEQEWASIFGYKPDSPEQFDELGEMYAVIRMQTEIKDFYIERFAKILVEELQNAYFSNEDGYKSTLQNLEEACFKMKKRMDLISSREDDLMKIGVDMEISVAVIKDKFLYVCNVGESSIYILRGDEFVNISEALVDKHQSNFFRSGSLELEPNDKLALATSKSAKDVEDIKNLVKNLDLNELNSFETNAGTSVMLLADENDNWVEVVEPEVEQQSEPESQLARESEKTDGELDNEELRAESGEPATDKEDLGSGILELEEEETGDRSRESEEQTEHQRLNTEELDAESRELRADEEETGDRSQESEEQPKHETRNTKHNLKNKIKSKFSNVSLAKFKSKISKPDSSFGEKFKSAGSGVKEKSSKVKGYFQNNQSTYVFYIKRLGANIKKLGSKIRFQFEKQILGRHMDRMYANKQRVKRNRWILFIVIIALSIFLYTSYRGHQNRKQQEAVQAANQTALERFNSEFRALESRVAENRFSSIEGEKDEILRDLNDLEDKIKSQKQNAPNEFTDDFNNLINKTVAEKDDLLLVDPVAEPQVIADISAEFQGVNLSDMEYAEGALFVTDEGTGNVYKLANQINSAIDVWISNLTTPKLIVKNVDNNLIVYDNNETSRVGKFKPTEKNSFERYSGLEPRNVGNVEEVALYDGNDALYELKPNYSQIFKRDRIGDAYTGGGAEREEVNPPNWKIDGPLSTAIDIETPGRIYVLSKEQGLLRYFASGDNEINSSVFRNLAATDLNSIKEATAMDVTALPAQNKLVIGDSANQRLLVFNIEDDATATLTFVKQIVFRGEGSSLSNIKEIQINGEEVFVLDGNRVLRFNL